MFDPCQQRQKTKSKSIAAWLIKLVFVLTFFAIPIVAWIHGGQALEKIYTECHMNVYFLTFWLLQLSYTLIGVYASIKAIGKIGEAPVEIQTIASPTKRKSPPQQQPNVDS